jgi:hypothetical protein
MDPSGRPPRDVAASQVAPYGNTGQGKYGMPVCNCGLILRDNSYITPDCIAVGARWYVGVS